MVLVEMELAKSFFKPSIHDGYLGREDQTIIESIMSDDEDGPKKLFNNAADEYDNEKTNVAEFLATYKPLKEGPFSAIIPSLCPQDVILEVQQDEQWKDYMFDEFGFIIDENHHGYFKNKLNDTPLIEDSQWRLQWIAQLNFDKGDEISWDNVGSTLPRTEKLAGMVKKGIPHSLRHQLWMRFAGTLVKREQIKTTYRDIMKLANFDEFMTSSQIEKDVHRTLPGNACFKFPRGTGIPRLRRILRGITFFFNDIGYCQGMGVVVAYLLLVMEEEDAFWTMVAIMEDLMPATYYTANIPGVMADVKVVRNLLVKYIPKVHEVLVEGDVDITVILVSWLLPAYGNVVHVKLLLRIWDLFFFYGSIVLIKICFGILKMAEERICAVTDSADMLNLITNEVGKMDDIDKLIELSFEITSELTDEILAAERKRHQAYLMVDRGTILGMPSALTNLPKQHLSRRPIHKSKSMIQLILFGDDIENEEDLKNKNVRQTEILVCLREAILQIAQHFTSIDPKLNGISLVPDYSIESHSKDLENYNIVSRNRRRRAKALLDFERHDDDELGFRKNDIITIISQKDEHCWVGELNGLRGWFPAKFVELLDERSKQYSLAGDDSVTENITDLVRGTFCPTVKQILEHGMKRPSFLGGPCHPWLFIEEASAREVEKDFTSVYSRLMLCKTYRLDEDGKVLTPEELLYRCVQSINQSHDEAHAQMDVKLRSLICLGLNEQVLHLWLEVLCSCVEVVQKWYHPWSFVCSPGWVQIKCELRILSQFAFNLNPEWELPQKKEKSQPLKDGVRDMLVKHHLFSWDL